MPYTRTVQTFIREGNGPPRVVTKTFTDDGDSEFQGGLDFGGRGGLDFGGRGFNARFGGRDSGMNIRFGGSRSTTGGFGTQRPQVCGRSTRKEKKNPFAGLTKQSYDDIVKRCKEEGILFEDPEFPAEDSSIFFSRTPPKPFEWKRPSEICDDPKWVSDGASRFDVQQGELGDCWLLAAVASLTCNQTLLHRVVPQDQRFDGPDYCGVFRFHFWHQGDWIEVVVDDRLPTYYNRLTFMHSTEKNEFWSALMEKAYAKLCGSYESLKGGSTCEAMEDFTGGVTESIDMKKAPPTLFSIMLKAYNRGSLMGCSIDADPNQLEAELSNGLVMGHAYSVTAVKLVEINTPRVSGNIPLIRVRNPWGNEAEWKGAWSDQSKEWQFISPEEKQNIGLTFDDDGEFWMSFDDFSRNFEKLEICNLGPDSLDEDDINKGKKRWEAKSELGEWIPRVNAGGCRNFLDTFAMNPQYRVTLTDPDDEDDDNTCTVLVGLLQKDRRKKRKEGLDMLTIGYVIYKLKDDGSVSSGPLDTRFFKYNASVAKSPTFINMREVCGRHKLPPGTYCIIPSTFEPNQQGEFLLRIFTEKASVATEMDESTQIIDDQRTVKERKNSHGKQPESDPYANREPPPIGFDLMVKDEVKRPEPPLPNIFGFPSAPSGAPTGPPHGAPGPMPGVGCMPGQPPAHGYPYNPNANMPNPAYPNTAPYQGGAGGYNQGYAPGQYNQGALGFQDPNQYYSAQQPQPGYQQPGYPGAPGYQPNQYYQSSQYGQPQGGAYAPQGAGYYPGAPAPGAPAPGYGWPVGNVAQGPGPAAGYAPTPAPSDPNQQFPMVQAQSSSMCMAAPTHSHLPPGGGGFIMPQYVAGVAAAPSKGPGGNVPSARNTAADGKDPYVRYRPGGGTGTGEATPGWRRAPPDTSRPVYIHTKAQALEFFCEEWKKPPPPPTQEEQEQGQKLREGFKRMAGEDMEIDAYELQEVVNTVFTKEFKFDGFSIDICRSMVAMHDGDLSGKLGFDEFKTLWADLRKWKAVFKDFDKDHSGHLSSYELRNALNASGFRLSNRTLGALIMRYSNKKGEIEFDDFVLCAIRLKTMLETFKSLDTECQGIAAFRVDDFIQTTMYS